MSQQKHKSIKLRLASPGMEDKWPSKLLHQTARRHIQVNTLRISTLAK